MSDSRYIKITIKAAVGVYLPKGGVADLATTKEALYARLRHAADWESDGRRRLSVEQLQAAAVAIMQSGIRDLVDDNLRKREFQEAIQEGGAVGRAAYEALVKFAALAMAQVSVKEVAVSDEHELTFEIEEEEQASDGEAGEALQAIEIHRKNLDAAWQDFEVGLDDMVREEEAAFRRMASFDRDQALLEETEAAQARAAEILVSARALADAEREQAVLELKGSRR